jgi:hypothetical protein
MLNALLRSTFNIWLNFMYDPEISALITQAFRRLQSQAEAAGPYLGIQLIQWMQAVSKSDRPEEAFKSPGSFPMLLLPWMAEQSLQAATDEEFQISLISSTASGYFYIRLMDNLMDRHGEEKLSFLPALNFFHSQFQSPYQKFFPYDHAFWNFFHRTWLYSAEVTLRDAELSDIDQETFEVICAQKTCAAKIPVAAVFLYHGQPGPMEDWLRFTDLFGRWHQMWNDIFTWFKDFQYSTHTYFLSEASRRKQPDEPLVDWVMREGFAWGLGLLDGWMAELQAQAVKIGSPSLQGYLVERQRTLAAQKAGVYQRMEGSAKLLASLRKAIQR